MNTNNLFKENDTLVSITNNISAGDIIIAVLLFVIIICLIAIVQNTAELAKHKSEKGGEAAELPTKLPEN